MPTSADRPMTIASWVGSSGLLAVLAVAGSVAWPRIRPGPEHQQCFSARPARIAAAPDAGPGGRGRRTVQRRGRRDRRNPQQPRAATTSSSARRAAPTPR